MNMREENSILMPWVRECGCGEKGIVAGRQIAEELMSRNNEKPSGTDRVTAAEEDNFRGVSALILLFDMMHQSETRLATNAVSPDECCTISILFENYLPGSNSAKIVSLAGDSGKKYTLGILDSENLIIPTKSLQDFSELLPNECTWYKREARRFVSPEKYLSPVMRSVLLSRLQLFSGSRIKEFAKKIAEYPEIVLRQWRGDEYVLRWYAAEILCTLPVFSEKIRCVTETLPLPSNPVLRLLGKDERLQSAQNTRQKTWMWEDDPFAWEDDTLHLISTLSNGEQGIISILRSNVAFLKKYISNWDTVEKEKLAQTLGSDNLPETPRAELEKLLESPERENNAAMPVIDDSTDTSSIGYKSLMRLLFGKAGDAMENAFSQCILLLPEKSVPASLNFLHFRSGKDIVLPPISDSAACQIQAKNISVSGFYASRLPDGRMTVSLTFQGAQPVAFQKIFPADMVFSPAQSGLKSALIFPAVNIPQWKSYCIVQNEKSEVQLSSAEKSSQKGAASFVRRDDGSLLEYASAFPEILCAKYNGMSAGCIITWKPAFAAENIGSAVISMDFGQSGVAFAIKIGDHVVPLSSMSAVSPVIIGDDIVEQQSHFIPMQPISPIHTSGYVSVSKSESTVEKLFLTGCSLVPQCAAHVASLSAETLGCGLLASGESRVKLAMQLMTEAALQAVLAGAADISWICVASKYFDEGTISMLQHTAYAVSEVTGIPLTRGMEKIQLVRADEALLASAVRETMSQNAAALAVGGGEIVSSLKMAAMTRSVSCVSVPWGMQSALLMTLFQVPDSLQQDFAALGNSRLAEDFASLTECAAHMNESAAATDKCGILMDVICGQYMGEMQQYMNVCHLSGHPTLLRSQMLLVFALSFALSGVVIEKVWQDDVLRSSLPGTLPLYIAGRGAHMMLTISDHERSQLPRFLQVGMSPNTVVKNISIFPSGMPKLELSMGAFAAPKAVLKTYEAEAAVSEIILRRFLVTFFSAYPDESQRLFGNVMCPDIYGNPGIAEGEKLHRIVSKYFPCGFGTAENFADAVFELENMR